MDINKTFQAISKAYGENTSKKMAVAASLRSVLEEANKAGFSGGVLTTIAQAIQCAEFEIQSDLNLMPNGDRGLAELTQLHQEMGGYDMK